MRATSRINIKYVLHPDGKISASKLAKEHKVPLTECTVFNPDLEFDKSLIHIFRINKDQGMANA